MGTDFTRIRFMGWAKLSWLTCPTCKASPSGFYWGFTKGCMFKNKNTVKVLCLFQRRWNARKGATADWLDTPYRAGLFLLTSDLQPLVGQLSAAPDTPRASLASRQASTEV